MFIRENDDGSINKIESQDVNFLEEDFPNKREIRKEIDLYETEDPDIGTPSSLNENVEEISQSLGDNRSDCQLVHLFQ